MVNLGVPSPKTAEMTAYHSNRNVYQTNSPEFEDGNGKNYGHPQESPVFFRMPVILASKSLLSVDTQRPFVGKFGKITDPKIGEI